MILGISGTRNFKDVKKYQKKRLLNLVSIAKDRNAKIYVGDCPTGIDKYCLQYCKQLNVDYKIFEVFGERNREALRRRTIAIVKSSDKMYCFPSSLESRASGTWLSCFEACRQNKKSFVCWDSKEIKDLQKLPKIKEINYWESTSSRWFVKPNIKYTSEQLKMEF